MIGKMKPILTYLFIVPVLLACSSRGELEEDEPEVEFDFPVFIDKEKPTEYQVNMIWMNDGNHNPLYFGEIVDTIRVERIFGRLYAPPPPPGSADTVQIIEGKYSNYFLDRMNFREYTSYDSVELNILVDTTQIITNKNRAAYPVMIENLHSDTIYIGYGSYIPIITEALNKKGEWKPIEERFIYMCGYGLELIILPPKQIVVTSELVYTGDFKTKLRIKLGSNYSREFTGSINLTQFESEWDSNGNSKPLPNRHKNR